MRFYKNLKYEEEKGVKYLFCEQDTDTPKPEHYEEIGRFGFDEINLENKDKIESVLSGIFISFVNPIFEDSDVTIFNVADYLTYVVGFTIIGILQKNPAVFSYNDNLVRRNNIICVLDISSMQNLKLFDGDLYSVGENLEVKTCMLPPKGSDIKLSEIQECISAVIDALQTYIKSNTAWLNNMGIRNGMLSGYCTMLCGTINDKLAFLSTQPDVYIYNVQEKVMLINEYITEQLTYPGLLTTPLYPEDKYGYNMDKEYYTFNDIAEMTVMTIQDIQVIVDIGMMVKERKGNKVVISRNSLANFLMSGMYDNMYQSKRRKSSSAEKNREKG